MDVETRPRSWSGVTQFALVVLVAFTLFATSVPSPRGWVPFGWNLLALAAFALWCIVGAFWSLRLTSRSIARRAGRPRERDGGQHRRAWWSVPCLAAATAVAVLANWPFAVRWGLSRSAFETDASSWPEELAASPRPWRSRSLRLGLYRVRRGVDEKAVYYTIPECDTVFGWGGFVYSPNGVPPLSIGSLGEGWYAWADST
jgi:hypothetical protein